MAPTQASRQGRRCRIAARRPVRIMRCRAGPQAVEQS